LKSTLFSKVDRAVDFYKNIVSYTIIPFPLILAMVKTLRNRSSKTPVSSKTPKISLKSAQREIAKTLAIIVILHITVASAVAFVLFSDQFDSIV
jgi:hypothetical protein